MDLLRAFCWRWPSESQPDLFCPNAASGRTIDFGAMGVFIFVMTATAIAAPGVPGGVITSSLGALGTILLLTPEQSSMLMTVYLAMDGVGSACSVGGHGAIAMAVERIVGKGVE